MAARLPVLKVRSRSWKCCVKDDENLSHYNSREQIVWRLFACQKTEREAIRKILSGRCLYTISGCLFHFQGICLESSKFLCAIQFIECNLRCWRLFAFLCAWAINHAKNNGDGSEWKFCLNTNKTIHALLRLTRDKQSNEIDRHESNKGTCACKISKELVERSGHEMA